MATTVPTDLALPSHYPPSQTALLLLDFHRLFVEKSSGQKGADALSVATDTKKWAKAKGIRIIHCLVDTHSTPFPTCKDAERLAAVMAMLQNENGDEPASLREDSEGDVTFTRQAGHVSALKSPRLLEYLHEKQIKSLILTGLSTSGCVLRTAVAAGDAEFVVTVLEDACADREPEVHDVMVNKVLRSRGFVYSAKEFQERWESRSLGM